VKNGTGGNSIFFDSKDKPDLIIFDPPYFDKKAKNYAQKSIARLPKQDYLEFFTRFFAYMKRQAKKTTRLAFIIADWRDFQKKPAVDENPENAILLTDYIEVIYEFFEYVFVFKIFLGFWRSTGLRYDQGKQCSGNSAKIFCKKENS